MMQSLKSLQDNHPLLGGTVGMRHHTTQAAIIKKCFPLKGALKRKERERGRKKEDHPFQRISQKPTQNK